MLNYLGQASLLTRECPVPRENPFFLLAPEEWRLPLVVCSPRPPPSSPARR